MIDAAASEPSRPSRATTLGLIQPDLLRPCVLRSAAAALPNLTHLALCVWGVSADWTGAAASAVELAFAGSSGQGAASGFGAGPCSSSSTGGADAAPPLLPSLTCLTLHYKERCVMPAPLLSALRSASQLRTLKLDGDGLAEPRQMQQLASLSQLRSLQLSLGSHPEFDELEEEEEEGGGEGEGGGGQQERQGEGRARRPLKHALVEALLPGQLTGLTRLKVRLSADLPGAALAGLTQLRELEGYDVDVAGVSGLCALTSLKANDLVPFVGGEPWVSDTDVPVSTVQSWPLPPGLQRLELSPRHPEELGFLAAPPSLREVVVHPLSVGRPRGTVNLILNQGRHTASEESEELLPAAEEALCRAAAFLVAHVQPTALEVSFQAAEAASGGGVYPHMLPVGGEAAMAPRQPSHRRWLAAVGAVPSLRCLELGGIRLAPQDFEAIATHMTALRVLMVGSACDYAPETLALLGPMANLRRLIVSVDMWPLDDGEGDGFCPALLDSLESGLRGLYSQGGFMAALTFEHLSNCSDDEPRVVDLRAVVARVEAAVGRRLDVSIRAWWW